MSGRRGHAPIFRNCEPTSRRILRITRQFVEKIIGAVEALTAQPHIGRKVPEAGRDDIRELIFRGYRIIYLTTSRNVFIVTVLHGSRDLAGQAPKLWDIV